MTDAPPIRIRQPRAPRLVGGAPPRLLVTIDLGENMGVTFGPMSADASPDQVRTTTYKLKGTTKPGPFLRSAEGPFREIFTTPGIIRVGVEKPDTNGNSYYGIRKNMMLLGQMYVWLDFCGLSSEIVDEVSVTAAKLRLAGHGRADKEMMIAAARAKGYSVETEHEADGLGIREVILFGKAETKQQREKREAAARRAAKEAAKKAAKGEQLL